METVLEVNQSDDWQPDYRFETYREGSQTKPTKKIWHVGPSPLLDYHQEYQKIAPFLFEDPQIKAHLSLPRIDFNSVGVYKPISSQIITSRIPIHIFEGKDGQSIHRRCFSNSTASELHYGTSKSQSRENSLPKLGSFTERHFPSKANSGTGRDHLLPKTHRLQPSLPISSSMQGHDQLQQSSSLLIVQTKDRNLDKVFARHPARGVKEISEWDGIRSRELSLNKFANERKEFSEPLPYVGTASNSVFSNLEMMELPAPSLTENEALGTIHEHYTDMAPKGTTEKPALHSTVEGPRSSLKSTQRVLTRPVKIKTEVSLKDQISSPTLSNLKELGSRNTSFRKLDTTTQHTQGTLNRESISDRTHKKRIGLSNSTPQILGHISNQIEDHAIRDRMMARESREKFKELATLFKVQQRQKGKYGHLSTKASMQDEEMTALLGTGSFYDKKMSASSHQDLSESRSFKDTEVFRRKSPQAKQNRETAFSRYQKAAKIRKPLMTGDSQTPSVKGPPQLVILEPEKPTTIQLVSESSEDGGFRVRSDLPKDLNKQDPFIAQEGPSIPAELSRISAPAATLSAEKPKKKVATINSIDDASFTSHVPSQRQVPLKGAIKIRGSVIGGYRPSKGSLFSIKEDAPGASGSTDAANRAAAYNLNSKHQQYGSSFRSLHPHRNSLFRRPSQIHRAKKPLFRSNVEQEAIEHTLASLRTNLDILRALFPVPLDEFIELLGGVTRNNPCAALLGKFLAGGKQPSELRVGDFVTDPQLKQNLPLMLADLKEFLIARRVSLLEHLAKAYLSNSVEFMKSSKLFQSTLIKKELMHILHDREYIQAHPEFKLTGNDSIKLVGLHHNHRVQDLVAESDSNKVMKLDKVNEYWKESNAMINEFLSQLLHPEDKKRQKVKLPDSLVYEFEKMRVQNSILSFHWQQPTAKREITSEP